MEVKPGLTEEYEQNTESRNEVFNDS